MLNIIINALQTNSGAQEILKETNICYLEIIRRAALEALNEAKENNHDQWELYYKRIVQLINNKMSELTYENIKEEL